MAARRLRQIGSSLGTRFARRVRFPKGREPPQGAVILGFATMRPLATASRLGYASGFPPKRDAFLRHIPSCAEMLPRLLMLATLGKQAYLTHNRKPAELRWVAMMSKVESLLFVAWSRGAQIKAVVNSRREVGFSLTRIRVWRRQPFS